MGKRDRRIALLLAFLLLALVISVWVCPRHAYAYEGTGDVYSSEEKTDEEVAEEEEDKIEGDYVSGEVSSVDEAMDSIDKATNELFDTSSFNEIRENYERPAWITSLDNWGQRFTISASDTMASLFMTFSGILIGHGALGVLFTGYYQYFMSKRFNCFIGSVDKARSKNGFPIGGNMQNGNNNMQNGYGNNNMQNGYGSNNMQNGYGNMQNGYGNNNMQNGYGNMNGNMQNGNMNNQGVSGEVRGVAGHARLLIGYIFDSLVYLAVIISLFILIKAGVIQLFLQAIVGIFTKGAKMLTTAMQGGLQ